MCHHAGIAAATVDQAVTIAALLQAHANEATLGPLTLGQVTDMFTQYLAWSGVFQVSCCTILETRNLAQIVTGQGPSSPNLLDSACQYV